MAFSYNGNKIDPSAPRVASLSVSSLADTADDESRNFICLQSGEPLTRTQKAELQEHRVQFQKYLGGNAWLCRYDPDDMEKLRHLPSVSRVFPVKADYKISPALKAGNDADTGGKKTIDVVMHELSIDSAGELAARISDVTGISMDEMSLRHGDSIVRLQVDKQQLHQIAKIEDVGSIDKVQNLKLYNNLARGILRSDFKLNDTNFQGQGQTITVADTGFDSGSKSKVHDAFKHRVVGLVPIGRKKETDDVDGHGTHVCGSALGDGKSESMGGVIQGAAPQAELVVQALLTDLIDIGDGTKQRVLFGNTDKDLAYLLTNAYEDHSSRIHTNSWGPVWDEFTRTQAPYGNGSTQLDDFVWKHQDLVVCFAAGNDGREETSEAGAGQVGGQSAAKNCITVGSCDNTRPSKDESFVAFDERGKLEGNPSHISSFSSRGPSAEGRIKPEVVAPGSMILSARSHKAPQEEFFGVSKDEDWMFLTGTSMATPLVAGCVAALREHLTKQRVQRPSAALIKALLVNGAVDLGKSVAEQGFGRVDLSNSIFDASAVDKGFLEDVLYNEDDRDFVKKDLVLKHPSLDKGSPVTLKATLVYMDQAGEFLQNNFNLVIHSGGKKRHGNKGDMQDEYDNINNVEQVIWKDLAVGDTVTFEVSNREVFSAPEVSFALAWSVIV
ncbi:hypothetical protein ACHAPU_006145 [Fusarium lateritium]